MTVMAGAHVLTIVSLAYSQQGNSSWPLPVLHVSPLGTPYLQLDYGSTPPECKTTRKVMGQPARTACSGARCVPLSVLPL